MAQAGTNETGQYLSFILDKESYAIEIGRVREVLELQQITRVPRTPDFFQGIINLRGHAVPVVDLRRKFGMTATLSTVNTCIVIMEVKSAQEVIVLGALVDAVREVFDLAREDIEPTPKMGTHVQMEFIQGIGRIGQDFVIIMDVDRVFSEEELTMVIRGQDGTDEDEVVDVAA